MFLIILSLALVETIGIYEIPILTAIASTFFLLEKTATHLQEPFRNYPTDTSVTAIARTIKRDCPYHKNKFKANNPGPRCTKATGAGRFLSDVIDFFN